MMTDQKGYRSQLLRYTRHYPDSSEMGARFYRLSRQNCYTMRPPRLGLAAYSSSQTLSEASRKKSKKLPKKLSWNSKISVESVGIFAPPPARSVLTSNCQSLTLL